MTLQALAEFYRAKLGPAEMARILGVPRSRATTWGRPPGKGTMMPISFLDDLLVKRPDIAAESGFFKMVAPVPSVESVSPPAETAPSDEPPSITVAEPPPPCGIAPPELPPGFARCMILTASNRPIHPLTEYCLRSLIDVSEGRVVFGEPQAIYDIFMARNRLADHFLQSGLPWSLWLDSDMILPCAKPEFYTRHVPAARRWESHLHASMNGIAKLASNHQADPAKKVVSALYFDRFGRGQPMFDAGRNNPDIRAMLNNAGPRWETIDAGGWAGTGALLVHRDVYLDIQKTQPEYALDRAKYPHEQHGYGFFDKLNLGGVAAHVGDYGYTHDVMNA